MDYKEKLKKRLYIAIIYTALGVMMIVGANITQTDNHFISSFGLGLVICGIIRIRNYIIITKNEETIQKQRIAENDERNIAIMHRARSITFFVYTNDLFFPCSVIRTKFLVCMCCFPGVLKK